MSEQNLSSRQNRLLFLIVVLIVAAVLYFCVFGRTALLHSGTVLPTPTVLQ